MLHDGGGGLQDELWGCLAHDGRSDGASDRSEMSGGWTME